MGSRFDSCSYQELTYCIKARIENIREYKKFRNSDLSKEFPKIDTDLMFKILICKYEIRELLSYRRILKREGIRNMGEYRNSERVNQINYELCPSCKREYGFEVESK